MPLSPEVTPAKKRKASSKSARVPPQNEALHVADVAIEDQVSPDTSEAAPIPSSGPQKEPYSWDRTIEAQKYKQAPFPPVPGNAKKLSISAFCEYWNSLPIPLHTHAVLYGQRLIPIMKGVKTVDSFGRASIKHPSCLKHYREHGDITEAWLISKLGYGKYSFRMNDSRIVNKGNPDAATIVFADLDTAGRPWGEHPPELDYSLLDIDDDRNKQFVIWAKSRGLIPNESQQESEDMQQQAAGVTERLTSTVERLTDKVISQAEAKEKVQPAAPAPQPSNGDGGAFKAVADLAIAVMNRPEPKSAQADPMAMVKGVVDMVKAITPAPDTASADLAKEVVKAKAASDERMFQLQQDQLTQARLELKEARAPQAAIAAVAPRTDVDVLQEMVTKQELLKKLTGRGGSSSDEEKPDKPGVLDKYGEYLPMLAQPINSIIQGFFGAIQAGFQSWQNVSYNNALARTGVTPQPPTMNAQQPKPGEPVPPQAPAPTPQEKQTEAQFHVIMQGVIMLAPHLVRHLDKGKSGAELAEFIIENADEQRTTYDRIRHIAESLKALGVPIPAGSGLEQFIHGARFVFQRIPALWAKVENLPTMPQFLKDFYNYDELVAEAQEEGEKQ